MKIEGREGGIDISHKKRGLLSGWYAGYSYLVWTILKLDKIWTGEVWLESDGFTLKGARGRISLRSIDVVKKVECEAFRDVGDGRDVVVSKSWLGKI